VRFTVGFDLDMTLIDPRAGIVEVFDVLAAESGIALDGRAFVTRLGPPLHQEFDRYGLDDATISRLVDRYRALTPSLVVPSTVAMPGAAEAVKAVIHRGGRAVVVTAKYAANARAHLDALGIEVSAVVGDLWSTAKAAALQELGAEVFVGDTSVTSPAPRRRTRSRWRLPPGRSAPKIWLPQVPMWCCRT